jgi:hypothetical protein
MTKTTVSTIDDSAPKTAAQPDGEAVNVAGANSDPTLSGKRKTITVHGADGDGGSDGVSVGVNGFAYLFPRNKAVTVPEEVVEALKNAEITRYIPQKSGPPLAATSPRFPMTVH